MTTFPAFATSFYADQSVGVTDVATILTKLSAILPAQTPAWVESPAGTFKSPVDAVGRFFKIVVSRISATRLQWKVVDQNGVTVCDRAIDIDAGGTTINYWTGEAHAFIQSERATPEPAWAGLIDETPYAQNAVNVYVFGNAYRNSAGTQDGAFVTTGTSFMIDNGTAGNQSRLRSWFAYGVASLTLVDGTGALDFFPHDMCVNLSGTYRFIGRAFQSWVCDSSIAVGTTKQVKIGSAGELGTFRVVSLGANTNMRTMVRVA